MLQEIDRVEEQLQGAINRASCECIKVFPKMQFEINQDCRKLVESKMKRRTLRNYQFETTKMGCIVECLQQLEDEIEAWREDDGDEMTERRMQYLIHFKDHVYSCFGL